MWQDADQDMFQKTGFMDDSFESREQAFPSTHFPPPSGEPSQQELPEREEPVAQVKPQLKSRTRSKEEKSAAQDSLLDPLLACMPGMQMGDADMEEFLGFDSPSLDAPVQQVRNAGKTHELWRASIDACASLGCSIA